MDFENVIYEKDRGRHLATITLNRPEKLNAINQGLKLDFMRAMADVEEDDAVKVVVIKGAGRSFSSGADLSSAFTDPQTSWGVKIEKPKKTAGRPSLRRMLTADRWLELTFPSAIAYSSKATLAQLHGHVLGLAFDLAMQCDLIIASEDAVIGNPMTRAMGPYYDGSASSWDLQFGIGLAKEHCFAPRLYDGREAYRLGIVNRVVSPQRLDEEVARYVQGISNMPADGIAIGKGVQTAFLDIMGYRKGFNS
ncbi:MAG: enoyl-CoA hydratase/isomerase family protein, partial [Chloroflexi bacterium]|nr:enoyl-CoA hydratase/isomerase family protein [Chloroflexota bacterium]